MPELGPDPAYVLGRPLQVELLRLSDVPAVTLRLGDPALLRWEGDGGYLELEVGSLDATDELVRKLDKFWVGQWRDWQFCFSDDRFFVSLELEWVDGKVWLRVDYHQMQIHLGVDWRVATIRHPNA